MTYLNQETHNLTYKDTGIKFELESDFIKKYSTKPAPFGFNGAGLLAYLRTYSRKKVDGTKEEWYETVARVVQGVYSIQKRHIIQNHLGWDEDKAQKSAQEMFEHMFHMRWLPPGRGIWAMGSPIIEEKGLFAALNNCAFVSTDTIHRDPTRPFAFLMDMSMLGVGVGFDTEGANMIDIHTPDQGPEEWIYTIPDTREGWVESTVALLEAFFFGKTLPTFDYSEIRPKGEPIKTFGGVASGPEPLINLHKQLIEQLFDREGQTISSRDIVDIFNKIGVCVVSGNVRRSAEIAFGRPDDEEYARLKDYNWNPETFSYEGPEAERAQWGWCSNNSIFAEVGMNYDFHGDQTAKNGEPGYIWMENAQKYGRMCDAPNWKDRRAQGANPCVEQTLESYELCCLVETFPARCDNLEQYLRVLKFSYLYAKTVTLGNTHWIETNRVMMKNRRIGCSMSGIAQFVDTHGLDTLKTWCMKGYDKIQNIDRVYSDWLAVPRSIKTTSVKPSGTVSLLPGVTPGVHFPEDNYYIRRVTLDKISPYVKVFKEAGYNIEEAVDDKSSVKVEIPVYIDGVRTVNEVSMWEQLSLAAFMQEYWADNQVSCTVTFQKHEAKDIPAALNYFQYKLKGISFLPKLEAGIYAQAPYEAISKEKFEELNAKIDPSKLQKLEGVEAEDAVVEKYCDTDVCEI